MIDGRWMDVTAIYQPPGDCVCRRLPGFWRRSLLAVAGASLVAPAVLVLVADAPVAPVDLALLAVADLLCGGLLALAVAPLRRNQVDAGTLSLLGVCWGPLAVVGAGVIFASWSATVAPVALLAAQAIYVLVLMLLLHRALRRSGGPTVLLARDEASGVMQRGAVDR